MGMNKIKYDKKDKKIYFILSVVTTITLAVCLVVLMLDKDVEVLSAAFYASLIIVASFFLPVISFAMWVMFFDSHMYLKRLEKHGFVIPNNKKVYDSDLDKLAGEEENEYGKRSIEFINDEDEMQSSEDKKYVESNESKALAYVSWFIALGMTGYTCFYFIRFSHMLENVGALGVVSIFITICWFIFGFYFFKQKNARKYRDDVDYKTPLKVRKHLVEGLATILILLAITVFGAANIYTMSKYVEHSKENPEELLREVTTINNI